MCLGSDDAATNPNVSDAPAMPGKPARNKSDQDLWYAPGLSFTCTQCGNCCTGPTGYVWFTSDESKAMAAHLNLTQAAFEKQYSHVLFGKRSLTEVEIEPGKFDCIFLTRDDETGRTGCSIYPVRPTQCRTWPFWPDNLKSPRHWEQAAQTCPGMKQGGDFIPIDEIRVRLKSNPPGL